MADDRNEAAIVFDFVAAVGQAMLAAAAHFDPPHYAEDFRGRVMLIIFETEEDVEHVLSSVQRLDADILLPRVKLFNIALNMYEPAGYIDTLVHAIQERPEATTVIIEIEGQYDPLCLSLCSLA